MAAFTISLLIMGCGFHLSHVLALDSSNEDATMIASTIREVVANQHRLQTGEAVTTFVGYGYEPRNTNEVTPFNKQPDEVKLSAVAIIKKWGEMDMIADLRSGSGRKTLIEDTKNSVKLVREGFFTWRLDNLLVQYAQLGIETSRRSGKHRQSSIAMAFVPVASGDVEGLVGPAQSDYTEYVTEALELSLFRCAKTYVWQQMQDRNGEDDEQYGLEVPQKDTHVGHKVAKFFSSAAELIVANVVRKGISRLFSKGFKIFRKNRQQKSKQSSGATVRPPKGKKGTLPTGKHDGVPKRFNPFRG